MHIYDIKIYRNDDLTVRSFIAITIKGRRYKEYNGNKISVDIKPNLSKTVRERDRQLKLLEFEYRKAIEDGRYKIKHHTNQRKVLNTMDALNIALKQKEEANLSKFYIRNLRYIHNDFIAFLSPLELKADILSITKSRIQEFLSKYNTSGTYYMNKRRDLGVLFSQIGKELDQKLTVIENTDRRKSKAKLHKLYEEKQLKTVLEYLKHNHENLYICCLLSYGCFLRPHREVRNLSAGHFKNNHSEIHLSGEETKGGRVRVVYVPDYVKEAIICRLKELKSNENLFSLNEKAFNEAYFNTAWTRAWKKMNELGIIEPHQTIYSFRHTAAVNVYKHTKDLHLLQQLLGHSDMIVTLKYLRGLGVHNVDDLKHVMPKL